MKKLIALLLSTLILASLLLTGCGGGTTPASQSQTPASPAATDTPSEAPPIDSTAPDETPAPPAEVVETPAPPTEVITLNMSTQAAELSINATLIKEWAAKVEEATNGQVKINTYYSSALVGEDDIVAAIREGITDIGEVPMARQAAAFPLTGLLTMQFASLGNGATVYENIYQKIYDKYPEVAAEMNGLHTVGFYVTDNGGTLHTAKEVRVPIDLNGLKVVTVNSLQTKLTQDAGGSPMSLEASEWYSSFERGLADGIWMGWGAVSSLELYKVLPYHTIFPNGTDRAITIFMINDADWNKVPADCQEAITTLIPWMGERWIEISGEDYDKTIGIIVEEGNQTLSELTPEEEAEWHDMAKPAQDAYLTELEGKGLPATAVFEDIKAMGAAN